MPYRKSSVSNHVTPGIFQTQYPPETQLLNTTGMYDQVSESAPPERRIETSMKKHSRHQIMQSIPTEENLVTERDELSLIPKPLYESRKSSAHTF